MSASTPTQQSAGRQAGAAGWAGRELGARTVSWSERDVILYALAVGAPADRLDLVFEDQLRALPTFALTLAQWAPDALGSAGAFEVGRALHGSQSLEVHAPLPAAGETPISARVAHVWDKGAAAVFDVEVTCPFFTAVWSIFAPGSGRFGGERGPARPPAPEGDPAWSREMPLAANAAALYRLLGDRHHIHIDPDAAAGIGASRPILHGLATLGSAVLVLADQAGAHPAELRTLSGRFASIVLPGETVTVEGWPGGGFRVRSKRGVAIDGGLAAFGDSA